MNLWSLESFGIVAIPHRKFDHSAEVPDLDLSLESRGMFLEGVELFLVGAPTTE